MTPPAVPRGTSSPPILNSQLSLKTHWAGRQNNLTDHRPLSCVGAESPRSRQISQLSRISHPESCEDG
eukprot:scaffold3791_cov170-Alexandrium_tamarense.AAC.2